MYAKTKFKKMKKYFIYFLFAFVTSTAFLISCGKDEVPEPEDPTAGLSKLAEGYATGAAAKVQVYMKETSVTSGYTKFYIQLLDSTTGNRIEDAHIQLTPMMDMGTMTHSSPYENPASEEAVNHLFPCSVTFIMSSMGGT